MSDLSGLEFSFQEFREEIQAMTHLAQPLLTPEAGGVLSRFEAAVRQVYDQPTDRARSLEIQGVCTRRSDGEYEKSGRKGRVIFAELSSRWQVMPLGSSGQKRPRPRFRRVGVASTCISLRGECDEVLARWHVDIADDRSPGCYFHIQVAQQDDHLPFPAWLPVPRFPSLLVTPMAVLDFVLGELFQDRWLSRTSQGHHHAQRWRKIQQKRWQKLLFWQLKHISELGETCSPWISIKKAQPPADLFLRKS